MRLSQNLISMDENTLVVETEQRLDVAMAKVAAIGSRSQAQKIIRSGRVTVDHEIVLKPSYRVQPKVTVQWELPAMEPLDLIPQPIPLEIVHEDESLLVVNKSAKMPVHPGAGRTKGTLVNALLHHVQERLPHASDEPFRPGIVHRLDMDTTGLLVVAKNDLSHRALQAQFETRSVKRHYVGIVWGVPEPRSGVIDAPIGRSPRNRVLMSVRPDGKSAITRYETHEILGPATLMRFELGTGRTHQIRVHLHSIGHPLMGDSAYGGTTIRSGTMVRNRKAFYSNIFDILDRQALHARSLGFIHPDSGKFVEFTAEMPEDMVWTVEQLQKDSAYK